MELACKNAGVTTPMKESYGHRLKNQECSKLPENFNPNVCRRSPGSKTLNSPVTSKSAKSLKSASKNPNSGVCLPQNKIRQRKFVTTKSKPKKEDDAVSNSSVTCKCKDKYKKKCPCVAYENLRVSQEEFLKNQAEEQNQSKACDESEILTTTQEGPIDEDGLSIKETESPDQVGSSTMKRQRDKLMEEARKSVPEGGCGRVMHLVKAFEKLLTIPRSKACDEKEEEDNLADEDQEKATKWALPGLQHPPKEPETEVSYSSFRPSDLLLTSEILGLEPPNSSSSSCDDNSIRESTSSRTSNGGQRSRRNSLESSCASGGRRRKKKHIIAISQKPFKLRTEQRGKLKEEEFVKKLQEKMIEEEKQRIPVAQGLPWTTDEPENLVKPVTKEITRPVDLKLHSDLRAIDRAEFDHQVAEKFSFIELFKMERERQQKLEEEEEIRRLRKELVPKAQPMPYFDRPFIPRRSRKPPTIPREPKFQSPQNQQHKKDQMPLIVE